MNGMCDVCGVCDEKIKSMDISGESFEVCVFCRKPIEELEQGNPDSIQAIENLFLMDTKGKRSEKCSLKLKELLKAHGVDASAIPKAELSQHMFGQKKEAQPTVSLSLEQQVSELQSQINELDDKVEKFRKRYFASKILGFVLPIVFVAVMLIILLASGALGNIFDYFGILSDYANM